MKFLIFTLILAASSNIFAQGSHQAKLATCSSQDLSFSFEFDHAYFMTPQAVKISVPGLKTEFLAEAYSASYHPNDFMNATEAEMSTSGNIYKVRKHRKQLQDGSFLIEANSVFAETTASGTITFNSRSASLNLKDQPFSCTLKNL